jgi:hypothetical protein
LLSGFLVLYLQPRTHLPLFYSAAIILVMEAVAIILAFLLVKGSPGQAIVRTLLLAFFFSAFAVYILDPTNSLGGLDSVFLVVMLLETLGVLLAWFLTRGPSGKMIRR